jgi:hypothetical protein
MTTTATTTNAAKQTTTIRTSGPASDAGLDPVTYRPGATPDTVGLVLHAVITVRCRLIIAAAAPDDAPVHTMHRRTGIGQMRCCPSPRVSPRGPAPR